MSRLSQVGFAPKASLKTKILVQVDCWGGAPRKQNLKTGREGSQDHAWSNILTLGTTGAQSCWGAKRTKLGHASEVFSFAAPREKKLGHIIYVIDIPGHEANQGTWTSGHLQPVPGMRRLSGRILHRHGGELRSLSWISDWEMSPHQIWISDLQQFAEYFWVSLASLVQWGWHSDLWCLSYRIVARITLDCIVKGVSITCNASQAYKDTVVLLYCIVLFSFPCLLLRSKNQLQKHVQTHTSLTRVHR